MSPRTAERRVIHSVLVAVGFALGLGVASVDREKSDRPATVEPLGGAYKGQKLRPVTVTENGVARRVGESTGGELVHIYLEVSGVPESITFDPEH